MCTDLGNSSAEDEIFEFTVASSGYWDIGTCWAAASYASFDTSLAIYMNDGACPGDVVDCNGDGAGCPGYSSLIEDAFLTVGNTYYLVVDAFYTTSCGTYTWVFTQTAAACDEDADCDDGLACNGAETCNTGTGACLPGTPPCHIYETCVEPTGECVDPDVCLTYLAGLGSLYFYPQTGYCHPTAKRGDDVELELHGGTRELISYRMDMMGRRQSGGTNPPVGTPYYIDTDLYLTELGTCLPWIAYPGAGCLDIVGYIAVGGTPPDVILCEPNGGLPTGLMLPDSGGVADLCEVDFYMVYSVDVIAPARVGPNIAGTPRRIGEPGLDDDMGGDAVFAAEACDPGTGLPNGVWGLSWFGGDPLGDFSPWQVCTVPAGGCCFDIGGCEDMTEEACAAAGGTYAGDNTMDDPIGCDDPDADGFFNTCDNCPDVANDGQEDCNDDGEGDACEADPAEQDADGDGTCNGVDGCPNDPLKIAPGQCGCGNPDTDSDLDGAADCVDECDDNPLWQEEPPCGCDSTSYDNLDDDGDGFPNCDDTCAGVDDAVFGPCDEPIPTVSEWGLVVLALLLLAAGKVYFGRRPEVC